MAREKRTVVRSDISGELIPEDSAVRITIRFADPQRNRVVLDAAESEPEIAKMIQMGRTVLPRERRAHPDRP